MTQQTMTSGSESLSIHAFLVPDRQDADEIAASFLTSLDAKRGSTYGHVNSGRLTRGFN